MATSIYQKTSSGLTKVWEEDTTSYAKLKSPNNLLHAGNEFTFVSPSFSGQVWLNYRTASSGMDGNITNYVFGNGKGGSLASLNDLAKKTDITSVLKNAITYEDSNTLTASGYLTCQLPSNAIVLRWYPVISITSGATCSLSSTSQIPMYSTSSGQRIYIRCTKGGNSSGTMEVYIRVYYIPLG